MMRHIFKRKSKGTAVDGVSAIPVSQRPTFPIGIQALYVGKSSLIDIVFVHGLTGNREKTWTAADTANPWPATILPPELPNTRILTFGYDAYVTDWRSMVSQNRVGHHAMNLLSDLAIYREKEETNDRPLIFVCHSLGGLVCEDALNLSRQSPEKHLQKILSSTRGILFLGTPHRGAGLADWASLLAQFIGLVKQANPDLLGVLRRESEILERIQSSFFEMMRVRSQEGLLPIRITCFSEELPLPGIGIVVPRESATIPGYTPLSIHQNHIKMTKFASADDPGFLAVVGQLHLWVKELRLDQPTLITTASDIVSSPTSLTASEKRYVTSFGPPTFIDIDDQIVGTCTWTTETAQYKRWNEDNGSAILWLTGNAGCGKTVLTNFLVQSICQQQTRQTSNSSAVICSFFCTRDREVLHDVRSLLRNLIRQILTNAKEVIHHIKALFGSTTNEYDPSFETLWRIFEEAIHRVPCQNVYLVIDALDECDEKWRSRFLLRLTRTMIELRGDGLTSRKIVRVVLSGQPQIRRPGAPIAGLNQYHLDLDQKPDGMIQDIRRFIGYKVKELVDDSICSESTGTTLRLTLESMSENSFLWLRMVVEHIRNSLRYHDTDVKQMLNEVPHDLQKAFAAYLPILPSSEIPLLRKYLYLIVGCARPLTVAEVDSFSNVGSKTFSSSENNVVMNSIRRALGPLIKFPNNTVQLVHSTAKEFFILLRSQPEHRCYASHGVDPKAADLFCAVRCMEYIAGEAVTKFFVQCVAGQESYDSSPISPRSTQAEGNEDGMLADLFDIEDVTFLKDQDVHHAEIFTQAGQKLEAYDYAVRNWTSHFARSEQLADEAVLEKAVELLSCSSDPVSNWYQYLAHFSRLDMPNSGECDAIVLAALFNHTRSLRVLLSRNRYTLDSIQLQRAMFWAASRGNCASVVILLDYGVQFSKAVHLAPLPVAIRGEHVDVCQMLLDSGNVDLNRADDEGKPPLVLAATLNHSTILGLLLQQPTVQVNLPDRWGRNALMVACASQSEECISALLKDSRSHHNDQAYNGYSPIHYAAQHGCDHAIKSLLTLQDLKIGTLTATGRSALSLAAQNGHLSIVRRLCHKGLSAAAKDTHGRNAISWATNSVDATSSNGAECVLQYLVRKFPDAADAADNNGWTPLAWAMDPPGYRRSVEILLRSGHVNINHRDRTYGRSILAWAASQGLVEILKDILKMDGVKKNSLSFDGRTPLSHAASNGMLEVVEVLVNDAEVSKHLPDASGRRPVDWARLNGHASIAALLKESAPCK